MVVRPRFIGLALLIAITLALAVMWPVPSLRVSHAGGGMPEGDYCNCREAFDRAYRRGFRYIETDFSVTTDGHLVQVHDWDSYYAGWSGSSARPSRAVFLKTRLKGGYHTLDTDGLLAWMRAHPDVRIITDVKGDNLAILRVLATTAERDQFIVQVYQPEQIQAAKALGFRDVIFTNYRAKLPAAQLKALAPSVWAVTVPWETAERFGPRTLAHTVNRPSLANLLRLKGVAGIYTDTLAP